MIGETRVMLVVFMLLACNYYIINQLMDLLTTGHSSLYPLKTALHRPQ